LWDEAAVRYQHEQAPNTRLRTSQYVTMRDGVKLATDLYLPKGLAPGKRLPALLCQTRYYRGLELRWPFSRFLSPPRTLYPEFFIDNGYAFVAVDTRGTGASYGHRVSDFSADEVADGAEIVNWIIAQPWSDGKVGSYGVSYAGTTAELLLANMHPAVKAAAVISGSYDFYADIALPGGMVWRAFNAEWSRRSEALDRNELGHLLSWWQALGFKGVRAVDSDPHGMSLAEATREHTGNYRYFSELQRVTYRDDRFGAGTLDTISPFNFHGKIRTAGVPIYSQSGWYDFTYARAGVSRFLTTPNPGSRVTIGPWTHGYVEIDPGHERRSRQFATNFDLLRFFDYYLKGVQSEIDSNPIHYWTVVENKWKSGVAWPPPEAHAVEYFFGPGHTLSTGRPVGSEYDLYRVDSGLGRADYTRWAISNVEDGEGYPKTAPDEASLLVYESGRLTDDTEVTGDPQLTLWLTSNASDGQFFVYLEDVDANGRVAYVTEGLLRGLHRRVAAEAPPYIVQGVWHSYRRGDALPLVPGEAAELEIDLLPISYLFRSGHRIRIALAGADKDHFDPLPGPPPEWRVLRDPAHPSGVVLPVIHPRVRPAKGVTSDR
jgi:putative CocE/NonD family hydrolase